MRNNFFRVFIRLTIVIFLYRRAIVGRANDVAAQRGKVIIAARTVRARLFPIRSILTTPRARLTHFPNIPRRRRRQREHRKTASNVIVAERRTLRAFLGPFARAICSHFSNFPSRFSDPVSFGLDDHASRFVRFRRRGKRADQRVRVRHDQATGVPGILRVQSGAVEKNRKRFRPVRTR